MVRARITAGELAAAYDGSGPIPVRFRTPLPQPPVVIKSDLPPSDDAHLRDLPSETPVTTDALASAAIEPRWEEATVITRVRRRSSSTSLFFAVGSGLLLVLAGFVVVLRQSAGQATGETSSAAAIVAPINAPATQLVATSEATAPMVVAAETLQIAPLAPPSALSPRERGVTQLTAAPGAQAPVDPLQPAASAAKPKAIFISTPAVVPGIPASAKAAPKPKDDVKRSL